MNSLRSYSQVLTIEGRGGVRKERRIRNNNSACEPWSKLLVSPLIIPRKVPYRSMYLTWNPRTRHKQL